MTHENFDGAMELMVQRHPFVPFVLALTDGARYEIDFPTAALWRPGFGKAIILTPGGVPVYIDHDSVVQIIDAPAHAAGKGE